MVVLTPLTSLICAFPLALPEQRVLIDCIIHTIPIWYESTRILRFLWPFWLTTKLFKINRLIEVNFSRLINKIFFISRPIPALDRLQCHVYLTGSNYTKDRGIRLTTMLYTTSSVLLANRSLVCFK